MGALIHQRLLEILFTILTASFLPHILLCLAELLIAHVYHEWHQEHACCSYYCHEYYHLRQRLIEDLALRFHTVFGDAFTVEIAGIAFDLIALAYDFVSAVAFGTARSGVSTVHVHAAFVVAVEEVRTFLVRATSRQAFEVVITVIIIELLTIETGTWIHTRVA